MTSTVLWGQQLPDAAPVGLILVAAAVLVGLAGLALVAGLAWWLSGPPVPAGPKIENQPPEGLRPATLRAVITRRADEVSLAATVVDLAARGYLHIERSQRFGRRRDFLVRRSPNPPKAELRPYEQELIRGLFEGQGLAGAGRRVLDGVLNPAHEQGSSGGLGGVVSGALRTAGLPGIPDPREVNELLDPDTVLVSSLDHRWFRRCYRSFRRLVLRDVVEQGLLPRNPSWAQLGFQVPAVLLIAAGVGGIAANAVLDLPLGLLAAPLLVVGVALLVVSRFAPRRTAHGAAVNRHGKAFRRMFRKRAADQLPEADRAQRFADYLAYAVALAPGTSQVPRWGQACYRLGVDASATRGWYEDDRNTPDADSVAYGLYSLAAQLGRYLRRSDSRRRRTSSGSRTGRGTSAGSRSAVPSRTATASRPASGGRPSVPRLPAIPKLGGSGRGGGGKRGGPSFRPPRPRRR